MPEPPIVNQILRINLNGKIVAYNCPPTVVISDIKLGPCGNLWCVGSTYRPIRQGQPLEQPIIVKVSTSGDMSVFSAGLPLTYPHITLQKLVIDSSGNLWVLSNPQGVWKLTTTGNIELQIPLTFQPLDLCVGIDENIWVLGPQDLTRISSDGSTSNFPLPHGISATALTIGGDERLWIACTLSEYPNSHSIMITCDASGNFTLLNFQFNYTISSIVKGPDGDIWALARSDSYGSVQPPWSILRISMNGIQSTFIFNKTSAGGPIVFGTDNSLWVQTALANNFRLLRITLDGDYTSYRVRVGPTAAFPGCFCLGNDGDVWAGTGLQDRAPQLAA